MEPGRSSTKLTYDDYVLLPDDGLRHEIIDGEHYVTASPATRHQRIAGSLYYLIRGHLEAHPAGEVFIAPFDVILSRFDVVEPDLIYLSRSRSHLLTEKNLQGAPDLAIEILSSSTRSRDERLKRDAYERTGVDEYWLVDPDEDAIVVFRRGAAGFQEPARLSKSSGHPLTTPLLPGFELPLDKVFA